MSTAKTSRIPSTPVNVPQKQTASRRKSILKNSLLSSSVESECTPASSPDCREPRVRRVSQVRFRDDLEDHEIHTIYAKEKKPSTRRKRTRSAVLNERNDTNVSNGSFAGLSQKDSQGDSNSNSDSLSDGEGSDSDDSVFSAPMPSLCISATMSPEAQYAALKTYEDALCVRIQKVFPDVALELKRNRTPDNRHTVENDLLDLSQENNSDAHIHSRSSSAHKVAHRLQRAMDILESVHQSCRHNGKPGSCSHRSMSKNPVRSFEKWCSSVRDTLVDLDLNSNTTR